RGRAFGSHESERYMFVEDIVGSKEEIDRVEATPSAAGGLGRFFEGLQSEHIEVTALNERHTRHIVENVVVVVLAGCELPQTFQTKGVDGSEVEAGQARLYALRGHPSDPLAHSKLQLFGGGLGE